MMPLGLTRNTLPLADRLPRMLDGSPPTTRLSATALALGWTKRTASPAPMLKLCQLIAAFWLPCTMVVLPAAEEMLAEPAVTTPPVGSASAAPPQPRQSAAANAVTAK
ncbi:hypothetical protein D3C78_1363960 [compost metagenome]